MTCSQWRWPAIADYWERAKMNWSADPKVKELAQSRNMSIKKQGGFVKIGPMGFIAIVTSAGIIIASEDRLNAVIELAKGEASDMALGAMFLKVTKSAGMAGLLTMFVGMESDNAAHNEAMAERRMINDFIYKNFPGVLSKYHYEILWGLMRTSSQYEVKDSNQYNELYSKIQFLVNNPYTFD